MSAFDAILDGTLPRLCGVESQFKLRRVAVEPGAAFQVVSYLRDRGYSAALVVADQRTWRVAGDRVARAIAADRLEASAHWVPDHADGSPPAADEDSVAAAQRAMATARVDVVVAVGSGTVCDIAKLASTRVGKPCLVVPTAPSMNGYTSAIAAVLVGGVKRTLPVSQVEAVFADVDVLRTAPLDMIQAGFGDLISKPFSNACWMLASEMAGNPRNDQATRVLDEPFERLLESAPAIGRLEPEAIALLSEVLLLSGCTMALAGSSAPASGGEHLLSHYWDMVEHAHNRPIRALHGTQVGIATALIARLYDRIVNTDVATLDIGALLNGYPASADALERLVRARHPALPPEVTDEVVEQALSKFEVPEIKRMRLESVARRWVGIRRALTSVLVPPAVVVTALRDVGAPVAAAEIGVDTPTLAHTLKVCRDIRGRYTVLDFAADLQLLEPFARECRAEEATA